MIRNNKWKLIISSVVILLPTLIGITFWDKLPEYMATHWGVDGNADGYSTRAFAVLFLPLLLLALQWLCVLATVKTPTGKEMSSKIFGLVLSICPAISVFGSGIMYAAALGKGINVPMAMCLFMGLLFIVIGNYLPKCKRSFVMGIKLKWTLESDANWNATHRVGGITWVIGGIVLMLCAFLPQAVIPWIFFAVMLVMVIIPTVYSYLFYNHNKKN